MKFIMIGSGTSLVQVAHIVRIQSTNSGSAVWLVGGGSTTDTRSPAELYQAILKAPTL